MHIQLAKPDPAGDDTAVVLEHVVRQLHVVGTGLQLDTAGAVTVPGHESETVDPSPTEPGAVLTRGQGGYVIRGRALSDNGEVGAPKYDARRPIREAGEHGRMSGHRGVERREVLLEEPAVDDAALDVEPRVLGIAALEFVRTDDAAWAETLNLQWLPDEDVLVVGARRQHQQAAGRRAIDRVLKCGRARPRSRWWRRNVHDRRVVGNAATRAPRMDGDAVDAGNATAARIVVRRDDGELLRTRWECGRDGRHIDHDCVGGARGSRSPARDSTICSSQGADRAGTDVGQRDPAAGCTRRTGDADEVALDRDLTAARRAHHRRGDLQ